jgi:hypothetical protein
MSLLKVSKKGKKVKNKKIKAVGRGGEYEI